MKYKDYRILHDNSASGLSEVINEYLEAGYELIGGVAAYDRGPANFAQAVDKPVLPTHPSEFGPG